MSKEHPLRRFRRKSGKSVKWIAEQLELAPVTVRSFENGHRTIQAEMAVKIEKLFGISRDELRPDLWQKAA